MSLVMYMHLLSLLDCVASSRCVLLLAAVTDTQTGMYTQTGMHYANLKHTTHKALKCAQLCQSFYRWAGPTASDVQGLPKSDAS